MSNITKKDIVDRIVDKTNEKRTVVKKIVQEFLDTLIDELSDRNRIELRDFGVFDVKSRDARVAQNPKTLEKVVVPAKYIVKFKPGRLMKVKVEKPLTEVEVKTTAGNKQKFPVAEVPGSGNKVPSK